MIEEGGGYYVGGGWRKGKMRIIQIMSIRSDGGRSVGEWPQGDTFAPTTTVVGKFSREKESHGRGGGRRQRGEGEEDDESL